MEKVIVAFESEKNCLRVKEILENAGVASCILCRSAAEVRRVVHKQHITTVICGYKFSDDSAENLFEDLPPFCTMLMLAVQNMLELCGNEDIFKLTTPVSRGELTAAVRMLTQISHNMERSARPRRSEEEDQIIAQAKELLITRNGMTEDQAHRFLQKQSMNMGTKLVQTAKMVLGGS